MVLHRQQWQNSTASSQVAEAPNDYSDMPKEAKEFIKEVEDKTGVPIVLIGTGPEAMEIIDRRK